MNRSKISHLTSLALAAAACSLSMSAHAVDAEQIVDSLNAVFGKQGHDMRASHAKGQCVKGTWSPTKQAQKLTKSPSFAKDFPVIARFSVGGGNPKVPDTKKDNVKGFALRIDPNGKSQTEFVMVNSPVHFAKTLEQMNGFLQVRIPGPDGKPNMEKVKAFGDANPETKRQSSFVANKPLPASYAGVNYWAVHAYTATNAAGAAKLVKFKFVPQAGELVLTDDEAKGKPSDFLIYELRERLSKAPIKFDVLALLGEAGDGSSDPSQTWTNEDNRKTVKMATVSINAVEDNAACNATIFNPTNLAAGIAGPTDDPFFAIRLPSYAISAARRNK